MLKCKNNCTPSCEFCSYAKRANKTDIQGCNKYSDEHHQSMAITLGYCKDFRCLKLEDSNGT